MAHPGDIVMMKQIANGDESALRNLKNYMDYIDLRSKTIFDVCNDDEILSKTLGHDVPPKDDRDMYARVTWNGNMTYIALSFISLAEVLGDERLEKEVERQFEDELQAYFNE